MKKVLTFLAAPLVAAFLLVGPSVQSLDAQAAFGVQGSWGSESEVGIGARGLLNIPDVPLEAVGSFDIFFPGDDVDWWELNGNVFYHIHLPEEPSVLPYLGAGLNVARISVPFDSGNGAPFESVSSTELGLNIGGGVRFPGPNVTPFVEGRAVISDADQVVLTVGLLFGPTRFAP